MFLKKINNLHPAIQFYFENKISAEFIGIVADKHGLRAEKVGQLVQEFVVGDFNSNIQGKIKDDFQGDDNKISSFIADFLGIIFYPIAKFLPTNEVADKIKENGGNVLTYEKYKNKLELLILQEENKLLDEIISQREKNVNIGEEYAATCELFDVNLLDILKDNDIELVSSLNGGMIFLLYNKNNFQPDILKILFNNQKKLKN